MPAPLSPLIVRMRHAIEGCRPIQIRGRVTQVTGTLLKAVVPGVRIGELCQLRNPDQSLALLAEVIGFQQHQALLTPLGEMLGVSSNTEVSPTGGMHRVAVGEHLLGQVLDGLGRPFDGSPPAEPAAWYPVYRDAPPPMSRRLIERPLSLGVRAIDGLLTCGEGQRMGIFAAAGGGKSTLLASLVRNAEVDVTVLALVGERGREVREFIESDLGEQGLRRSVLVVATSDRPAMERAKAGFVATSIAEYFRDQGRRVLLLMDSLTRFARAQREIGLAAGEPPTRRGYPPSVFAALPRLMERAGQSERGSITALYTVLVEGDDMSEPVADETRSILDGHIVLSRKLAAANHYPAIDVLHSGEPGHEPDRRRRSAPCGRTLARMAGEVRGSRVAAEDRRIPERPGQRSRPGHREDRGDPPVAAPGYPRNQRLRTGLRAVAEPLRMSLALLLRVRRLRLDRAERAQGRQLLRVRAAAQGTHRAPGGATGLPRLATGRRATAVSRLPGGHARPPAPGSLAAAGRTAAGKGSRPGTGLRRDRAAPRRERERLRQCRRELLERQRQLEKFAELERHVDAERQGLRERSEEGELEEFTRHETWPCSS